MDENAVYGTINIDDAAVVVINFEKVAMINSKGIQIWKEYVKSLPPQLKIAYARCPLRVVNQLNLFPSFSGGKNVVILSFYAPYFCEPCDGSHSILLEPKKVFPDGKIGDPPEINCPACSKAMEFDGSPAKYLLFLKRAIA